MILSLIILYVLTLIYLSIADRFRNHTSILAIQGLLIFGIAMARLHEFHTVEMIFIIVETLLFKAIVIPAILMRVIHKTKINRIHSAASQFGALVMSIAALIASCTITYYMADNRTDMIFFGVALYALLTGLILIVMRKRIFAHLVVIFVPRLIHALEEHSIVETHAWSNTDVLEEHERCRTAQAVFQSILPILHEV